MLLADENIPLAYIYNVIMMTNFTNIAGVNIENICL